MKFTISPTPSRLFGLSVTGETVAMGLGSSVSRCDALVQSGRMLSVVEHAI